MTYRASEIRSVDAPVKAWAGISSMTINNTFSWHGFIDDGAGNGRPSGVAGTILTVTSGNVQRALYFQTTQHSDVNRGYQIGYQISGTENGAGRYQTTINPHAAVNIAAEDMSSTSYDYVVNGTGMVSSPPVQGDMIQFRADQTSCTPSGNPANCTPHTVRLSGDNGSTYQPVVNTGGAPNLIGNEPTQGYIHTAIYDADLKAWVLFGYASPAGGINCGPPFEAFIQLNAELGTNPWIVSPYMGADPLSTFMPSAIQYVHDNYSSMKPEGETSNELWNNMADNSQFARNKMLAHAYPAVTGTITPDSSWVTAVNSEVFQDSWVGKTGSVQCQMMDQVYASDHSKYECIVGVHTNGGNILGAPSATANARLLSTAYINQTPPAQSGYTKTRAGQWATGISVHTYWNGGHVGTQQEVAEAYNYFNGDDSTRVSIASDYVNTTTTETLYGNTIAWNNLLYASWYAWATSSVCPAPCSFKHLHGYEGGYGITLAGTGAGAPGPNGYRDHNNTFVNFSDQTIILHHATNASPCVLSTTTTSSNSYVNSGGNSFNTTPGYIGSIGPTDGDFIYNGADVTGTGVATGTKIQGLAYAGGVAGGAGPAVDYVSPSQHIAPTTFTLKANGTVAGMPVTIMDATGGSWSSLIHKTFKVKAPADRGSITLQNIDGSDFDCSGTGTLTFMVLAYTGSGNWINALRRASYYNPAQSDLTIAEFQGFVNAGGTRASQFVMSSAGINGFLAWGIFIPDLYAHFPDAYSTSSTLAPSGGNTGVLTLGGNKDSAGNAVSLANTSSYNSTTGVITFDLTNLGFYCNANVASDGTGPLKISSAIGIGANVSALNGVHDAAYSCDSGGSALTQSSPRLVHDRARSRHQRDQRGHRRRNHRRLAH